MTTRMVFAVLALTVALAGEAFAQASPGTPSAPAPVAPAPAAAAQTPPLGNPPAGPATAQPGSAANAKASLRNPARKVTRQETLAWRQACRDEARGKGLTQPGPARRQTIQDCLRRRPEILRRIECRRQGRAQELEGPQLRNFLRRCYRG